MSRSDDPDHYFQTSDSIATSARKAAKSKNDLGSPISIKSKLLAVVNAASGNAVHVAGADGLARSVDLDSRKTIACYTGAAAPLTSLATFQLSPAEPILLAGCWDKSIFSWNTATGKLYRRFVGGHTDFVKCVIATRIAGRAVLISGSADATIIVWDLQSGKKLHTLKGHTRGVLDLAIDPTSPLLHSASGQADYSELRLFSADSVREIRQWTITADHASATTPDAVIAHETSVNRLHFEPDADADLWTASSDRTAKRLVRSRDWEADTVLEHPDYVRDVVGVGEWVVTACRDEEVRVWDASSGRLVCVYSGHFEEVTGLVLSDDVREVVSVSLDGTIRRWGLDAQEMKRTMEEREKPPVAEPEPRAAVSVMTAEEEAELAELMDSD